MVAADEPGAERRPKRDDEEASETRDQLGSLPRADFQPLEAPAERPPAQLGSFSRLDPNRRSFSSPSVNLAASGRGQQQPQQQSQQPPKQKRPSCGKQRPADAKQAPSKPKQRRRTALGLISSLGGAANFRLSPAPPQAAGEQAPGWRLWFSGASARAQPTEQAHNKGGGKKFLLRNLTLAKAAKQAQQTQQASAKTGEAGRLDNTRAANQSAVGQKSAKSARDESSNANKHSNSSSKNFDKSTSAEQHFKESAPSGGESVQEQEEQEELEREGEREEEEEEKEEEKEAPNGGVEAGEEQKMAKGLLASQVGVWARGGRRGAGAAAAAERQRGQEEPSGSLVDRLIDSQLEWRQLIQEANAKELGADWSLSERLTERQIKRQEVIHELVQTERHHCLTLALMRQVYCAGLRKLNETRAKAAAGAASQPLEAAGASQQQQQPELIDLERLFPALEELVQAHELFFAHLRLRLVESCQRRAPQHVAGLVGPLGDLLCDQFRLRRAKEQAGRKEESSEPGNGHKLLQAYAKFCGQHYDSSRYYKQLMLADKQFKQFIELCHKEKAACRQRGIPECNLLVTQRLTKYPLLMEQLIKSSQDEPEEEAKLREALNECKALLAELNSQLARKESFERLLDIYAQFCPKSYTIYNKHLRFTKHDLLQHKRLRQLLHSDDQVRIWSATRRKLFQVLCLMLNDIIVFLRVDESPGGALSNSGSSSALSVAAQQQQQQHCHLAAADLSQAEQSQSDANEQQHQSHHAHLQLQQLMSQCALINAVTSAFHAGGAIVQAPAFLSSAANNSAASTLLNLASGSGQQGASSAGCQQSNTSSSSSSSNNNNSNNSNNTTNNGLNVKYYFANIDNKSSVISLSKLLIREKAVNDGQPRIYLISSSPRQPEMYELAFISKRHQASFIEKLKACIEQHNQQRHLAAQLVEQLSAGVAGPASFANCLHEDDDFEELEVLHGGRLYEDGEAEQDDETLQDDEEEEDEEEEDEECDECAEATRGRCCRSASCGGANAEREAAQFLESRRKEPAQPKRRWRTSTMGELEFEHLDIEQDLVAPNDEQERGEPQREADLSASQNSSSESLVYSTPLACGLAQSGRCSERGVSSDGSLREPEERQKDEEEQGKTGEEEEEEEEEEEDEANSVRKQLGATSQESGLSERAKDSLDEAAPSKQKLRGARRRRAQRPRQVSNQSSSSSEAAGAHLLHHQPHSMGCEQAESRSSKRCCAAQHSSLSLAADEEFDSGRGLDDSSCCSSSSGPLTESGARPLVELSAAEEARGAELLLSNNKSTCDSSATNSLPANTGTSGVTQEAAAKVSSLLDLKLLGAGAVSLSSSTLIGSLSGAANHSAPQASAPGAPNGPSQPLSNASSSCASSSTECSTSNKDSGKSSGANSASSCASSTASGSTSAAPHHAHQHQSTTTGSARCGLVKCASLLKAKGASVDEPSACLSLKCSLVKQRKLSTVSTMSSQLKLFNKLKTGFDGSASATASQTSSRKSMQAHCVECASLQQEQFAHQSLTMSKQMRQQMRRSSFVPEQKLEELRDLRIQLDKDKQEWQEKFDRMQEQLLNERRELDLARERLKQDRQQVANERELLYRKLEALKEKGILLSPSHKVIITAPEQRSAAEAQRILSANQSRRPMQPWNQQAQLSGAQIHIIQRQQAPSLYGPPGQSQHSTLNQSQYSLASHLASSTANVNQAEQQAARATSSLFIQGASKACKVPLHLSEHSAPSNPNCVRPSSGKINLNLESHLI